MVQVGNHWAKDKLIEITQTEMQRGKRVNKTKQKPEHPKATKQYQKVEHTCHWTPKEIKSEQNRINMSGNNGWV